ncbi:MAG: site-specific integrase [Dehalococcoidia bacterium]
MSIRERGKNNWQINVDAGRDESGRRQRRFYTFAGTKRAAKAFEAERKAEIARGTSVDPSRLSVGELLSRWQSHYVAHNVRGSTARRYGSIARRLTSEIGAQRLQALKPADIQAMYVRLLDAGLSPRTVLHHHRVLREALAWAMRMRLIEVNAADAATPPKATQKEVRALSPSEVGTLIASIEDEDLRRVALVTVATGMRIGEVLALRWSDLEDGQLRVERAVVYTPREGFSFEPPKTRAGRRAVALGASTIEVLREHRVTQNERRLSAGSAWADNDLIFPDHLGNVWAPYLVSKSFTSAARAAGFDGFTFHGLRHTTATLMLRGGVDAKLAAARLGHSSPVITQTLYQHVAPDLNQRVAEALDVLLTG